MSEVEWREQDGSCEDRQVRIFLLGLADNEAAIVQVRARPVLFSQVCLPVVLTCLRYDILLLIRIWVTISRCMLLNKFF